MSWPPHGSLAREPQPGDVYEYTADHHTTTGFQLPKGTRLSLIEQTNQAPHGVKDPAGNWLVEGPNGKTVWSSIRYGIANGQLKLVMQLKVHTDRFTRIDKDIV